MKIHAKMRCKEAQRKKQMPMKAPNKWFQCMMHCWDDDNPSITHHYLEPAAASTSKCDSKEWRFIQREASHSQLGDKPSFSIRWTKQELQLELEQIQFEKCICCCFTTNPCQSSATGQSKMHSFAPENNAFACQQWASCLKKRKKARNRWLAILVVAPEQPGQQRMLARMKLRSCNF